ncbi:NERD domain-containing protein [Alicyclobacillus fastidiosus]|uniref:NERD domain-containing protein n=1 Tax=Alicyclobacillus fastidiosus TaxID=392011 RepID=A0ABY6ZEY0_9BACL|nr:NERD domain-containing protein [Alicyclobacillus fastidiosus]WAH40676.1 NERD domain-containing protein [Alicyclobacillus fastidiosus]
MPTQVHIPSILFISIPLIIVLLVFKQLMPKLLGHRGESIVRSRLDELDTSKYIVVNDLLIPNQKSKSGTSQIDHVVVSRYGVFIIETKNYSGRIMGKETDAQWTQVNYRRKDRFGNPLRQNYGHVQAIKELLGETLAVKVVSIVAFTGNAELWVDVKPGTHLIYTRHLRNTIDQYDQAVLSTNQVNQITEKLRGTNIGDYNQRKKHTKNIQSAVANHRATVKKGICPKCGGTLVKRTGKYGSFTGCSNFPKCYFTAGI